MQEQMYSLPNRPGFKADEPLECEALLCFCITISRIRQCAINHQLASILRRLHALQGFTINVYYDIQVLACPWYTVQQDHRKAALHKIPILM